MIASTGPRPLLDPGSPPPPHYALRVADFKRLVERWMMDAAWRAALGYHPVAALSTQFPTLTTGDIEAACSDAPLSNAPDWERSPAAAAFAAFMAEKRGHLTSLASTTSGYRLWDRWQARQRRRLQDQLGFERAAMMPMASVVFELTEGCSMGCWFCGLSSTPLTRVARWAEAGPWFVEVLDALVSLLGPLAGHGALYWATDPLDNPDYALFRRAFARGTGICPQTTTAQADRHPTTIRDLLAEGPSLGGTVDRFSVLSVAQLRRIHRSFTPLEMLPVECLPQFRSSSVAKVAVGRARGVSDGRQAQVADASAGTIACLTGLLVNVPRRSVTLMTPCPADDMHPDGCETLATMELRHDVEGSLRAVVEEHVPARVRFTSRVALRADLRNHLSGNDLVFESRGRMVRRPDVTDPDGLLQVLRARPTVGDLVRQRTAGASVPATETLTIVNEFFEQGLLDEALL